MPVNVVDPCSAGEAMSALAVITIWLAFRLCPSHIPCHRPVCSDADSLSQHLETFGEIRITRLEPETTVAWEGERASGTVRIEPSGWGTKVTITANATEALESFLDSLGQAHHRPFSR